MIWRTNIHHYLGLWSLEVFDVSSLYLELNNAVIDMTLVATAAAAPGKAP
jgi:hypothetical protein